MIESSRRRKFPHGFVAAGLLLTLLSTAAAGHAMNSAQWRLVQRDTQTWDSRLRLPEDFEGRLLSLHPQWPADCERRGEPHLQPADEGTLMSWTLDCPQGLQGALGLSGFSVQLPDAILLVEPLHGAPRYAVLSATRPQWRMDTPPEAPPVPHYLGLGVEHILLGPDHLLFVLGLWALWRRGGRSVRALVGTLTAFTAAHSITLAGAALGHWSLPSGAVEASIAASILLLAIDLAFHPPTAGAAAPSGVSRHLSVFAFGFGLLHGFGFAGALAQIGLPEHAQVWALAAFNLGVEAGQLLFVLALMLLAHALRPLQRWAPVALCLYGSVAAYWLIQRSATVFT
ncbi:HupE/UreJ family protein [Sinimarinibacterium sp. CAU 1509]|uniref:HupE/UreJ family protein n=1 Tax=Sinimarinibacterium sp. CAU 1509 TaxID=2562283 RepID=UPI0010AC2D7C|nr:HupE/UreJ family protein [Sinimarinibacterium sp. CAU 1509]TJY62264.1 HupE/UreJ family protein [Sinimarinibacterium sp. CAU 1509]